MRQRVVASAVHGEISTGTCCVAPPTTSFKKQLLKQPFVKTKGRGVCVAVVPSAVGTPEETRDHCAPGYVTPAGGAGSSSKR